MGIYYWASYGFFKIDQGQAVPRKWMQFLNFAGPHAQGCFVVVAVVPFYVYAKAKVIQILPKYVSSNRMPHRNIQKEKDTEKSI